MLKSHTNFLLYKVCLPNICLTAKGIDMFECNYHEFVHYHNSLLTNFYNPRMTSITLITDLVENHGKDITQGMIVNLTDILSRYACSAWGIYPNNSYLRRNLSRNWKRLWLHQSTQTLTIRCHAFWMV